jgi:mannose-6-phosphate isomerase-like protein (cupin superfamily)
METVPTSINLEAKLAKFTDRWHPKIISTFNGHDVMVVKLKGEFVWHSHPDTDDFFLVLKGTLRIDLRIPADETTHVELNPGELYVVPKGIEHRPMAIDEVHLLLIEPIGTPNTGDSSTAVQKESI